jgi:L-ribulose-5-phosphate 3-epimerase
MGSSLERALTGISRAGFEYVELLSIPGIPGVPEHVRPEDLSGDALGVIRRLVRETNLTVISISGHVQLLVKKHEDTPTAIRALKKRIELAHKLGAKYVNTGMWALSKRDFYETIYDIADFCRERQVMLGLEIGEPGLTCTGKESVDLLQSVNLSNVGLNYDTGNIRWSKGVNAEDDLPLAINRVIHMHVKDQVGGRGVERYPPLGEGEVNFPRIFNIVKQHNFTGPFCLEIEMPISDISKRDEDVKNGLQFITNQLS